MKKISILILCFCSYFFSGAQVVDAEATENIAFDENKAYHSPTQENTNIESVSTPIWEEDFANGFPQGWSSYTYNTQGGASQCNWVWSNDGSWGYYQGTQGASAASGISSTTAANGFLISDTDSANHHTYGQPSGTTYQYIDSYFTTSSIDLSNYPAVSLEFEQMFRYNNLGNAQFIPPSVWVSSDSIVWSPAYQVHGGTPNNTGSGNPEYVSLNISAFAANQPTVYIKIGWTSRCYYWMIDDMKIVETPDNLIKMQDETFGGWNLSNPSTTGDMGIPYTFNPMEQVQYNPYRFEARVLNQGGVAQTNTQLNVNVTDLNGATSNFSSTPTTVQPNDTLDLSTSTQFSPTTYGPHSVDFWVTSAAASTDTATRTTVVTDTVYGRDYDWATDGTNAGSGYYLGRQGCGQVLVNAFELYTQDTITSISFHVSDQSVVGAAIRAQVYEYDATQSVTATNILVGQSDVPPYILTAADLGSWVTLKVKSIDGISPVIGTPGATTAYLAGVLGYQSLTDTSLISSSGQDGVVTYIQDNGCNIGSGGFGAWYSASKTLMIRMNLGRFASNTNPSAINDNIFNGSFKVYPNPSNGNFSLELDKVKSDVYKIRITDVLGREVLVLDKEVNSALKETIDLSSCEKGTYLITITNTASTITEKLIIE